MKRLVMALALIGLGGLTGACALPPAVTIASYALDGISYFSTGKSVSDHAISAVAAKDCALWRMVKGELICREYKEGEQGLMMALAAKVREGDVQTAAGDTYFDDPSSVSAPPADTPASALLARQTAQQTDGAVSPATLAQLATLAPAAGGPAAVTPEPGAKITGPVKPTIDALLLSVPADTGWQPVLTIRPRTVIQTARRRDVSLVVPQSTVLAGARVLMMGSFADQANAHQSARRWQALDPTVVPSRFGGRTIFRVVAGPFSVNDVVLQRKRLARLGIGDAWSAALCPAASAGVGCIALEAGRRISDPVPPGGASR